MTKGNDGRFRIQLTPDIVGENNSFKFTLDNPNEGEKKWMPSGMDLSFTQNNGSNLYIAMVTITEPGATCGISIE